MRVLDFYVMSSPELIRIWNVKECAGPQLFVCSGFIHLTDVHLILAIFEVLTDHALPH